MLLLLWFKACVEVIFLFWRENKMVTKEKVVINIDDMLRTAPRGVGADKLREFLKDPMDDNDVRQDEKNKPTMVEHIKLLRDRLEKTTERKLKDRLELVQEHLETTTARRIEQLHKATLQS